MTASRLFPDAGHALHTLSRVPSLLLQSIPDPLFSSKVDLENIEIGWPRSNLPREVKVETRCVDVAGEKALMICFALGGHLRFNIPTATMHFHD